VKAAEKAPKEAAEEPVVEGDASEEEAGAEKES